MVLCCHKRICGKADNALTFLVDIKICQVDTIKEITSDTINFPNRKAALVTQGNIFLGKAFPRLNFSNIPTPRGPLSTTYIIYNKNFPSASLETAFFIGHLANLTNPFAIFRKTIGRPRQYSGLWAELSFRLFLFGRLIACLLSTHRQVKCEKIASVSIDFSAFPGFSASISLTAHSMTRIGIAEDALQPHTRSAVLVKNNAGFKLKSWLYIELNIVIILKADVAFTQMTEMWEFAIHKSFWLIIFHWFYELRHYNFQQ